MNKKNLGILFASLTFISAFFCFFFVQRAVTVPGASIWVAPSISFAFFLVFLFGAIIFIKKQLFLTLLIIGVSLVSILFGRGFWQIPLILIGTALMIIGASKIRKDLELNIKLDFVKSLYVGKSFLISGMVLIIVAQYFVMVGRIEGDKVLPKLEMGKTSGQLVMRFLASMSPAFEGIKNDELTADDFILQTQSQQLQSIDEETIDEQTDFIIKNQYGSAGDISQEQRDFIKNQVTEKNTKMQENLSSNNKNLILREGRKQLSQMTGQEIVGNEKMYDIISGLLNKKINDYLAPTVQSPEKAKILPVILAFFLFFTLWPIGSLLGFFCIRFFAFLMYIFRKTSVLVVKKVMVEMEIIE